MSSHHAVRHVVGSDGDLHTERLADQASNGGELSGVEVDGAEKEHLEIRVHAARRLEVCFLPNPLLEELVGYE